MAIERKIRDLEKSYIYEDERDVIHYNLEHIRLDKTILDDEDAICDFKGTYKVDLNFWGLDLNPTELDTVTNLNLLFKWCLRTPNLTKVIFPYNIPFTVASVVGLKYVNTGEDANLGLMGWSIIMDNLKNLDIDFNHCTIIKAGNPYQRSYLIEAEDVENCNFYNLNLLGDRLTHDYSFVGADGTDLHEFGHGFHLHGACKNVTFYNCEIKRVTGYGAAAYQLHPRGIGFGDFSIAPSVRLGDIEAGDIDDLGNEVVDITKTRSQFISLRQEDIDSATLYLNGWGFYSARGVDPGIEIKVYFYNSTSNLLDIQYSDEGGKLNNVEGTTQVRLVLDQPLYDTFWTNGSINPTTGIETAPYVIGVNPTEFNGRYGYTPAFIDLTSEELLFGGHKPEELNIEGSEKGFGDFTGLRVFYYDVNNNFISSSTYQVNIMAIPATATKYKMTGSSTEWVEDNDRFYIAIAGLRISENIKYIDCRFIENRGMGLAGIFNGLLIENCEFIRNGVTIQGNDRGGTLGRGIDLEEGARLTRDIVVRDSLFRGNDAGSILLWTVKNILIEDTTMEDSTFFAYPMNDLIEINNCTFRNKESITVPEGTILKDCKFYNTRITSASGNIIDSKFFDCEIKDSTASKIYAPFLENSKILIKNSEFYITNNFPRVSTVSNFITINGSTEVIFDKCEIYDLGTQKTYLTTYASSVNTGFTNPEGGLGVSFRNCYVDGLYIFTGTRIKEIINTTFNINSNFNGSIVSSNIPEYSTLKIENSSLFINKLRDSTYQGEVLFEVDTEIDNSKFTVQGESFISGTSFMLNFQNKLDATNSVFRFISPTANRAFRAFDSNNEITNCKVDAINGTADMRLNSIVKEYTTFNPVESAAV